MRQNEVKRWTAHHTLGVCTPNLNRSHYVQYFNQNYLHGRFKWQCDFWLHRDILLQLFHKSNLLISLLYLLIMYLWGQISVQNGYFFNNNLAFQILRSVFHLDEILRQLTDFVSCFVWYVRNPPAYSNIDRWDINTSICFKSHRPVKSLKLFLIKRFSVFPYFLQRFTSGLMCLAC